MSLKEITRRIARGSYIGFLSVIFPAFAVVIVLGTFRHLRSAWFEFADDIRSIDWKDLSYANWKKNVS